MNARFPSWVAALVAGTSAVAALALMQQPISILDELTVDDVSLSSLMSMPAKSREQILMSMGGQSLPLRQGDRELGYVPPEGLISMMKMQFSDRSMMLEKIRTMITSEPQRPTTERETEFNGENENEEEEVMPASAARRAGSVALAQKRDAVTASYGADEDSDGWGDEQNEPEETEQDKKDYRVWSDRFSDVQAAKSSYLMAKFITKLIKHRGGFMSNEGDLWGFVPFYSGEAATNTYDQLLDELAEASWVQNFD